MFNIVHIHINDTSDEVPIDVEYLDYFDYKIRDINFKKDFSGVPLRYKILVWNWQIRDVLYNNGTTIESVMFQENVIRLDFLYVVNEFFGKIKRVPYALLTYPN